MAGLPMLFGVLCMLVLQSPNFNSMPELDAVEYFAGMKAITTNYKKLGYNAASFELMDDPLNEDLLSAQGYSHAVALVLKTKWGGALWTAPVCSTWVWINRGTSERSWGAPLGDVTKKSVRDGNLMVHRMVLLLLLASSRGIWWVLEQPRGSLLWRHPAWQELIQRVAVFRHSTQLGRFGGATAKATWLWSNRKCVSEVEEHRISEQPPAKPLAVMVRKYVDGSGKNRVSGGRDLKASQAYPFAFGMAVAKTYAKHYDEIQKSGRSMKRQAAQGGEATMEPILKNDEAELQSVLDLLVK